MTIRPEMIPLTELSRKALELLARELGPSNAARFLGQFTTGLGDYTKEREQLFHGLKLDEVTAAIKQTSSSDSLKATSS